MRLSLIGVAAVLVSAPVSVAAPDFNKDVASILVRRCIECHSGAEPSGKLNLTTAAGLKSDGIGALMMEKVDTGEMPPKKQKKSQALPKAEADVLRTWIAAGAPWPANRKLDLYEATSDVRGGRDWWSFQAVKRPALPDAIGNPIDHFIRKDLAAKNWQPAPEADRRTLIRRLSFDLLGLPPTADEIDAFVADRAPDAYEKLVDKYLAAPQFGERWARHWLDIARYAETCGYERDQTKPHAWKYRDWVVDAINSDKPFDRFLREQIAGDELPDRSESTVIATGFLRLGTWNDEPNDANEYKYERLEDMVHATTTAFLSLTVKCARCHDHKFDPIPQRDYYRVAAAFWAGPIEPGSRDFLGGPTKEQLGYDVLGWTDRGPSPAPLKLLKKGDPLRPTDVVPFGMLSVVPALDRDVPPTPKDAKTTGRRLALANWIADPANPLTPRVWVNRLWQHHFGMGLVRSPDNFGYTGEKPTHPELLDYLASELVRVGWKSKPLHRLIVTSATYKQASIHPKQAEYAKVDAGNKLWWHAERRRFDAESLRDSLLFTSGQLDLSKRGGPSFVPDISAEALEGWSRKGAEWKPSPPEERRRRTLYAFVKRGLLNPTQTVFDSPDTTLPCGQRDVTIVPTQALAMLNNAFVHRQSAALAKRALEGAKSDDEIARRLWRSSLGRDPRATELDAAKEFLIAHRKRFGGRSCCEILSR